MTEHTHTPEQVAALADAMGQLLDDVGTNSRSISKFAQAKARYAFEPFLDPDDAAFLMPLAEAKSILVECGYLSAAAA